MLRAPECEAALNFYIGFLKKMGFTDRLQQIYEFMEMVEEESLMRWYQAHLTVDVRSLSLCFALLRARNKARSLCRRTKERLRWAKRWSGCRNTQTECSPTIKSTPKTSFVCIGVSAA